MLYYGTFKNHDNTKDVAVYIQTGGDSSETVHMGDSAADDIQFLMRGPVKVEFEPDNTFDVLIPHTCTINLLVRNYLGDSLFTANSRDVIVNVWEGDRCVFAGFVEPSSFNQPYDHTWNQFTLNCTDAVSTLQYYNYQKLNNEDDYNSYKQSCGSVSILTVLSDMLRAIPVMDLRNGASTIVYYDGSVRLSSTASAHSIFEDVQLYELLFLGEEFDDVWNLEDVFFEILQYFNLHMRQEGTNIYIYHLASVRERQTINWTPLLIGNGNYKVSQDTVIVDPSTGIPHEELIPIDDGNSGRLPGKELPEVLGDDIVRVNNSWRRYYYWVMPNGDRIRNENHWELVTVDDALEYIKLKDNASYKVLVQSTKGDYDFATLESAPDSAFSGGSFKHSYFQPKDKEFLITKE